MNKPIKGRPSRYNTATAKQICKEISKGKNLRSICRKDNMPAVRTVYYWLQNKAEFQSMYNKSNRKIRINTVNQ